MLKKILFTIGIFISPVLLANGASTHVYLKSCKTSGTKQDTQIFTRCMNSNFQTIDYALPNDYLNNCPKSHSMRQQVVNCHNSNFLKLKQILNLSLKQCQNFGSTVTISYQYCVNDNFRKIEYNL